MHVCSHYCTYERLSRHVHSACSSVNHRARVAVRCFGCNLLNPLYQRYFQYNGVALISGYVVNNTTVYVQLDVIFLDQCGPGSSVGIATDYGLDGPG